MSFRGNVEDIKAEVTQDLIDFVEDMELRYQKENLYGKEYLKVYGDTYRDLQKFRYEWIHKMDSEGKKYLLHYCNISSDGYWYCSVVMNLDELDIMCNRYLFDTNW